MERRHATSRLSPHAHVVLDCPASLSVAAVAALMSPSPSRLADHPLLPLPSSTLFRPFPFSSGTMSVVAGDGRLERRLSAWVPSSRPDLPHPFPRAHLPRADLLHLLYLSSYSILLHTLSRPRPSSLFPRIFRSSMIAGFELSPRRLLAITRSFCETHAVCHITEGSIHLIHVTTPCPCL